jgi:hypothetical protein
MTTNKPKSTSSFHLHPFEEFGNEISARRGFEATVLKCSGDTGEWTAGKKNTRMNGKKLVADIIDLMKGWLSFKDGKPIYGVVRVEDRISPPQREDLGDTDEQLWGEKQEDPWKKVIVLPFFDPETRASNVKVEHNNDRKEPPPCSDDELNQLMRESKERADDDVSFGPR